MAEISHDTTRLDRWEGDAHDLWMVTAIIQPFKLDAVTLALEGLSMFGGMTVSDCRGFGRDKVRRHVADDSANNPVRAGEGALSDYTPKIRIDAAVAGRSRAAEVARVIARAAHTGRRGDGKVFLSPFAGAIGIREFDVDHDAL